MKVSAQYAGAHLDELLSAAERGEVVEIARADRPSVRLTLVGTQKHTGKQHRKLGAWEGKIQLVSDEEWSTMDEEIEREFSNSSILPSE